MEKMASEEMVGHQDQQATRDQVAHVAPRVPPVTPELLE